METAYYIGLTLTFIRSPSRTPLREANRPHSVESLLTED